MWHFFFSTWAGLYENISCLQKWCQKSRTFGILPAFCRTIANSSTKFLVIILFCKSQLSAENYTSGAKQSLDSSRGNEVLLCCIIMGPLVSPWTRRKTWVALETYNIFFFCCCALPAKTFISIFWPRPKYILLHLWNRNICRKMPAKLRIINWSTLWNKFRRLVCFISHKLLTWFLEAIK